VLRTLGEAITEDGVSEDSVRELWEAFGAG